MVMRMSKRGWALIGVVGVLSVMLAAVGTGRTALAADEAGEHGAAHADNPLHDVMEELGTQFRDLRRAVRRAEDAPQALELLQSMQALAVQAKALEPKQVEDLPEAERPSVMRAYQLQMVTLLEKLLATERALLEERHTAAGDLVKEIYIVQRDAHREFRID
jgi:hypothetical protein